MNLKRIDESIERYTSGANEQDKSRYAFFRGLWDIQNEEAARLAPASYVLADDATLESQYWDGIPAIRNNPVPLDAGEFAAVCSRIAAHMANYPGLSEDVSHVLASYDWKQFVDHSSFELAGSDPAAYIEDCLRRVDYFGVDAACPSNVFMMVPSFALRPFFQQVSADTVDALKGVKKNQLYHNKPLRCPVCGSSAAASFVGGGLELESHGRGLYCATCGATWDFERIRCACCGTRNQGHLHWLHVEGDSAHRIHVCDECGGYTRTVFQDDLHAPLVMEVEDVAMAFLDEVAATL